MPIRPSASKLAQSATLVVDRLEDLRCQSAEPDPRRLPWGPRVPGAVPSALCSSCQTPPRTLRKFNSIGYGWFMTSRRCIRTSPGPARRRRTSTSTTTPIRRMERLDASPLNETSPYDFFVGALPAGQYFVALHAVTPEEATSGFTYSGGSYLVNDIPTLKFTTPSDEGSSEDFATVRLGNPWDFASLNDIDYKFNIHGDGITSLPLTNELGASLGSPLVYLRDQ